MGATLSKAIARGLVAGARLSAQLSLIALFAVALSVRSLQTNMKGRGLGGRKVETEREREVVLALPQCRSRSEDPS